MTSSEPAAPRAADPFQQPLHACGVDPSTLEESVRPELQERGDTLLRDVPSRSEQDDLLAAGLHILGRPFRVFQWPARDPRPGYGQQGLHADGLAGMPGEAPQTPDRVQGPARRLHGGPNA